MFPHGVVYEGVSEEPMSFRGESGANDSMVSTQWDGSTQRNRIYFVADPAL